MAEAEGEQLNGTKLDKIPLHFQLGDNVIDGATIRPMSFQTFSGYISEAVNMTKPDDFDARLRRVRLLRQVSYHVNGTTIPLSVEEVLRLPIPDARKILARLNSLYDGKPTGKIIRDGNGIDQAIVYELGTPIPLGKGKEPIRELEFHASTYGDIEDVLAEASPIQQTAKLIKMAKPLGGTLMVLPDWALDQITVADGMTINAEILPRFTGSPDE